MSKSNVIELEGRDHSIEQIAYSLGYSSPAHFSRSFKQYFDFSPSELRQG